MKTKDELLQELEALGIGKTGRKLRTDKSQSRGSYTRSSQARADKGQSRANYVKTAAHYKQAFASFILAHTTETGDLLTRDSNEIFPPQITNYYKLITTKTGLSYRSSVKRINHPELLRWRWWFMEWADAVNTATKDMWTTRICDWYFIKPEDLEVWTYEEWSWAYYTQIGGRYNRLIELRMGRIILSYESSMNGEYGIPERDKNGDIIWSNYKEVK